MSFVAVPMSTFQDVAVPAEILEAERKISNWMAQQGAERWALNGICSRNIAEMAEQTRLAETKRANELEATLKVLEKVLPTTHELKCWPEFFEPLRDGDKTFEIRLDDRGYKVGDTLVEMEWCPHIKRYTGGQLKFRVTYIMRGQKFGLEAGWVIMGIKKI